MTDELGILTSAYRVELVDGVDGWFWRVISRRNGEVLCHSEVYTRRWSASRTARAVAKGLGATFEVAR